MLSAVGDAAGELLQLLRLALHEPVVLLLHALNMPRGADGAPGRQRGDHRAQPVELPGEPVSPRPGGLDPLGGALGHMNVVGHELVRCLARRVAAQPHLGPQRLVRQIGVSAARLLQGPLRRLVEGADGAVQLSQQDRFRRVGRERHRLLEQLVDALARFRHVVRC